MKKIPTLFVRDPDNRSRVTPAVTPGCEWVLAGEGTPTRKYDGTCVLYKDGGWWARREVKPGKTPPPNYMPISTDPVTGKTVGWEPMVQSSFAKFHAKALETSWVVPDDGDTYELCGPKINGNPERIDGYHVLIRHGHTGTRDVANLRTLTVTFDGLRDWLGWNHDWEGIVFHHADGRMAKIKVRDFEWIWGGEPEGFES